MSDETVPVVAVVGGGPAGLAVAERLRAHGVRVDLYEAMGSVGRRFLIAGKGGLNLTHSEPFDRFVSRFREQADWVRPWLQAFGADALRDWARGLGVDTLIGSSGRVFPMDLKAAPLLRGWVRRLREHGVRFHVQHRWLGWSPDGALRFLHDRRETAVHADAVVLALGGASWPEVGGNAAWITPLRVAGIEVAPLRPSNCGFECAWSEHFRHRHAGAPVKPVRVTFSGADGVLHEQQGEFIVTTHGIEGSLVYALSAPLRDAIEAGDSATLTLDLLPDRDAGWLQQAIARPRGKRSLSEHLRRSIGLDGVKAGLLHECQPRPLEHDPSRLAAAIKQLPLRLMRTRPIEEAISSAGGVKRAALDERLMLRARPGTFCAGEMLDWEAPTGGYLLTASFASAHVAADGVLQWLAPADARAQTATAAASWRHAPSARDTPGGGRAVPEHG